MNGSSAGHGEEKDAENLGARLKKLRLDRYPAETQAAFAERCGIHVTLISRIEQGHVSPTLPTMRKLARALDLPLSLVVGE